MSHKTKGKSKKSSGKSKSEEPINPPDNKKTINLLAVISLILAVPLAPLAIVLALIANRQIKNTGQRGQALVFATITLSTVIIIGLAGFASFTVLGAKNKKTPLPANTVKNESASKEYTAEEKKAADKANSFLAALSKNDYTAAYEVFSPELKASYKDGAIGFQSETEKTYAKILNKWSITEVASSSSEDRINVKGTTTFDGTATITTTGEFEIGFYNNNGDIQMYTWRISSGQ
ncbi:DUF4190 domain-containing protein [Patescibacteria group bacterium]|nr:DUF4190 domain-containing protein [Patescibacteria group bacterium]